MENNESNNVVAKVYDVGKTYQRDGDANVNKSIHRKKDKRGDDVNVNKSIHRKKCTHR